MLQPSDLGPSILLTYTGHERLRLEEVQSENRRSLLLTDHPFAESPQKFFSWSYSHTFNPNTPKAEPVRSLMKSHPDRKKKDKEKRVEVKTSGFFGKLCQVMVCWGTQVEGCLAKANTGERMFGYSRHVKGPRMKE